MTDLAEFTGPADGEPGAPLTARQDAFAGHYAICRNGAEAARRAGYKASNARYAARDNLRNDAVRRRIRALAAAQAEQRRDETVYLLMMLNAAMESALRHDLPNPMIRALALMARMTGLDKPAPPLPASDGETDGDAALAFADTGAAAGLIQEAIDLAQGPDRHSAPTEHHKTPHPEKVSGVRPHRPQNAGPAPDGRPHDKTAVGDSGPAGHESDDARAPDRPAAVRGDTEGSVALSALDSQLPDVAPALSRGPCDVAKRASEIEAVWPPDQVRHDTGGLTDTDAPGSGRPGQDATAPVAA